MILTPYEDFRATACVMTDRDLREGRVHVLMAVERLVAEELKYRYDELWDGYVDALAWLGVELCREWGRRDQGDNCEWQILDRVGGIDDEPEMPPWLGVMDLHVSHRAKMVRDDPTAYRRIFPNTPDVELWWP